ncbi:MAG: sialidase family protein [Armatimonadota bacterium]
MSVTQIGAACQIAAMVLILALAAGATPGIAGPQAPTVLSTERRMVIVRLPDSRLLGTFVDTADGRRCIMGRYSSDNGFTWTEPEVLHALPDVTPAWGGPETLVDSEGELHLFLMRRAEAQDPMPAEYEGVAHGHANGYGGRLINIWYVRSSQGRTQFTDPRLIWWGYTGSLNSVIQMEGGRMLLPFSATAGRSWADRGEGFLQFAYMGSFNSTLIYSDDGGDTWMSAANPVMVEAPVHQTYGAIEPVVVQLSDGRVWMLIRTQWGRFYESFSNDGTHWSPARPTDIINSDSPAGLVRLDDGRLVLFANRCLRFPYAFGGRHVLHAAVSTDDGRTWRGWREVARDPRREEPPPPGGDFGTAYPMPAVANDGRVIYSTGQGEGRALLMLLDPEWLMATGHESDFTGDGREEWSIFGTRGVGFRPHPADPNAAVLSLRKTSPDWPAATTWNFPIGARGRLRMRLMLVRGFGGALIGLTDHWSAPFDEEDHLHNLFNVWIDRGGILRDGRRVKPGEWHDLSLDWSTTGSRRCRVSLDGEHVATVPLRRQTDGANYLRVRSTAAETDLRGMMIESVAVTIEP